MKKIKIGVIGSESSHIPAFAKLINIENKVKNCSIDYLWGETSESAVRVSKEGNIPYIVSEPTEMKDKIDALIVGHRYASLHINAALPFVESRIPIFIDKPLCYDVQQGRNFLNLCKEKEVPVTSFSVLPLQKSFGKFFEKLPSAGKVVAASIQGTCDIRCQYDGVFFLGSHLVEMALEAFGYNVVAVMLNEYKTSSVGQLFYSDGSVVTLNFMFNNGYKGYGICVHGTENSFYDKIAFDENWYYTGVKKFTDMFQTKIMPKPIDLLLKPVEILKALEVSLQEGKMQQI